MMDHLLTDEYYHNTLLTWAAAALAIVIIIGVLRLAKTIVVARLKDRAAQTPTLVDDIILYMAQHSSGIFQVAMGMSAATYIMDLPGHWERRIRTAVVVVAIVQAGVWGSGIVKFLVAAMADRRGEANDVAHQTARNVLRVIGVILVWTAVALLCMDNLGINVTTLIAGLGVTGVAVALATQNIVSDLFASISILLDKPFLVGDFIISDAFMGTVERIGIRTSRLRSLGGELLIMANSDLAKSRLRNYSNMYERRIVFTFSIRFETPVAQVKAMQGIVREAVLGQAKTRFDRCQCLAFTDTGLSFETAFYVLSPDYNLYTEIQHQINLTLLERLEELGIKLAYRTQINYQAGEFPRPEPARRAS